MNRNQAAQAQDWAPFVFGCSSGDCHYPINRSRQRWRLKFQRTPHMFDCVTAAVAKVHWINPVGNVKAVGPAKRRLGNVTCPDVVTTWRRRLSVEKR